jgi:hypothetical protein
MRFALAGLMLVLVAAPALAQDEPQPLAEVYACAAMSESAARLACYDAAVGRLRQAQSSGEVVAFDRAAAETIEREGFGLSLPSLPRLFAHDETRAALSEQSFEIARVVRRGDGRSAFVMSNGQTWTQVDTAPARRIRAGGRVVVRRAALGSFLMVPEAGGAALRVRRED